MLEDIKDRFGLRLMQDVLNVISYFKSKYPDANLEEVLLKIVEEETARINTEGGSDFTIFDKQLPKCPECGEHLFLRAIGVKNKYNYKSHWYCMYEDCLYEKYSTNDAIAELKSVGIFPKRKRR